MAISVIAAWIATICALFASMKYLVKKNKKLNMLFHKIHIPMGAALIGAGIIHGIFAGNRPGTALGQAVLGQELFSINPGTICLILAILLALSYVLRKKLRKNWMHIHRLLTVMMIAAIGVHVAQVGISLPDVIFAHDEYKVENAGDELEKSNEDEINASGPADQEEADPSGSEENGQARGNTVAFSGATLKDGIYEGSAEGYKSQIKVSVKVEGGAVTEINIDEENETPKYFARSLEIIDSIIDSQTLEVDGITGATYSSKAIQTAVYNALQNALVDGQLNISDIQINDTHDHKRM